MEIKLKNKRFGNKASTLQQFIKEIGVPEWVQLHLKMVVYLTHYSVFFASLPSRIDLLQIIERSLIGAVLILKQIY